MWPRKLGRSSSPTALGRRAARLGELARDAAELDHRHAGAVDQHHRHLEDDLQLVPDGVGGEVGERLGAVTGLEEKGLAVGDLGQSGAQAPGLPGEDQRRQDRQRLESRLQVGRRPATPAAGQPGSLARSSGSRSCPPLQGGRPTEETQCQYAGPEEGRGEKPRRRRRGRAGRDVSRSAVSSAAWRRIYHRRWRRRPPPSPGRRFRDGGCGCERRAPPQL